MIKNLIFNRFNKFNKCLHTNLRRPNSSKNLDRQKKTEKKLLIDIFKPLPKPIKKTVSEKNGKKIVIKKDKKMV